MRERKPFKQAWRETRVNNKSYSARRTELKQKRAEKTAIAKASRSSWNYKLADFSNRLDGYSNNWIRRVTIPILLFGLGTITFPLGIIFWILALFLISGKRH